MVSEPILFLHLPKTAGTALRILFVKHLGEQNVSKPLSMRLDEALIRYADLDAICGHFFPEQGQSLPEGRISITVLRDPIDRFLSYFYFRKFDAQNSAVDQRVRDMSIDQFVDELANGGADIDDLNLQTTMLYPFGTASLAGLSWPERVAAAQRALDQIDYVGIHGEIDDLVCMISARMGWPTDASLDRINVTTQRIAPDQLTASTRTKLEELLQYDQLVFEHAVARFRRLRRASIVASSAPRTGVRQSEQAGINVRPQSSALPDPREFGDRRLELVNVRVSGEMSGDELVLIGERINIHIEFIAHETVNDATAGFLIRDEKGLPVFGTNTHLLGDTHQVMPGRYSFNFSFINRVECGSYVVDVMLIRNSSHLEGCHHWKDRAARFDVHGWAAVSFNGRVMMDASASVAQLSAEGRIEVSRAPVDSSKVALSQGRLNPPLRDFSAGIVLLSILPTAQSGAELLVDMEVQNTGTASWGAFGKQPVGISYHWYDSDGSVIEYDGLRSCLPRDLAPGERQRLYGLLRVPHRAGTLRLVWTLVQEGVGWFDENNPHSQCSLNVTVNYAGCGEVIV